MYITISETQTLGLTEPTASLQSCPNTSKNLKICTAQCPWLEGSSFLTTTNQITLSKNQNNWCDVGGNNYRKTNALQQQTGTLSWPIATHRYSLDVQGRLSEVIGSTMMQTPSS